MIDRYKLKYNFAGDDYSSYFYFTIEDNGHIIWESKSVETDSYYNGEREELEEELSDISENLGIKIDTSSPVAEQWKII